jgi:hypothetical protein
MPMVVLPAFETACEKPVVAARGPSRAVKVRIETDLAPRPPARRMEAQLDG